MRIFKQLPKSETWNRAWIEKGFALELERLRERKGKWRWISFFMVLITEHHYLASDSGWVRTQFDEYGRWDACRPTFLRKQLGLVWKIGTETFIWAFTDLLRQLGHEGTNSGGKGNTEMEVQRHIPDTQAYFLPWDNFQFLSCNWKM